MHDTSKQIIFLVLSLVLSIVVGFVPSWTKVVLTVNEQMLLTIALFTVFLLVDILWVVANRLNHLKQEYELWRLRESGDWDLNNIRSSFFKIVQNSYGKKDLFVAHFIKEFQRLSHNIQDVADKQELRVAAYHFLSVDNVLDAFGSDDERIWRYTWPLTSNEKLFEELPWKRYFENTARMVQEKRINNIRAILILDNIDLIADARIRKLLDYFQTNV